MYGKGELKQLHFYKACFERADFITKTFAQGKDDTICRGLKLNGMANSSFPMGGAQLKRISGCAV